MACWATFKCFGLLSYLLSGSGIVNRGSVRFRGDKGLSNPVSSGVEEKMPIDC